MMQHAQRTQVVVLGDVGAKCPARPTEIVNSQTATKARAGKSNHNGFTVTASSAGC